MIPSLGPARLPAASYSFAAMAAVCLAHTLLPHAHTLTNTACTRRHTGCAARPAFLCGPAAPLSDDPPEPPAAHQDARLLGDCV